MCIWCLGLNCLQYWSGQICHSFLKHFSLYLCVNIEKVWRKSATMSYFYLHFLPAICFSSCSNGRILFCQSVAINFIKCDGESMYLKTMYSSWCCASYPLMPNLSLMTRVSNSHLYGAVYVVTTILIFEIVAVQSFPKGGKMGPWVSCISNGYNYGP